VSLLTCLNVAVQCYHDLMGPLLAPRSEKRDPTPDFKEGPERATGGMTSARFANARACASTRLPAIEHVASLRVDQISHAHARRVYVLR
jgi:hypothetical protein